MQELVGGEVVAAMLGAEGVDTVFGIVDGTYLGLLAGLEKHGITLVSPRHETTAAHMAGAYARSTGRLGVCIASNGPGVANILPGVAVENGEGNRVLLVTSSRRSGISYPDRGGTYQYFDQHAVIRPMAKWSGHVPSPERLPELARRAMRIAWRGRPGVVHLDVGEDVLNGTHAFGDGWLMPPASYRRTHALAAHPDEVAAVASVIRDARRPMIHVGSGVIHAGASAELAALAEELGAPVTTSWGAQSALASGHPCLVPVAAQDVATAAHEEADAFLVIAARLGETDWWGRGKRWGAPGTTTIQVDVDDESLGRNRPVDIAVLADARSFTRALLEELKDNPPAPGLAAQRRAWGEDLARRTEALDGERLAILADETTSVHPAQIPVTARRVFGPEAMVVIDGGNTAVWATMFHKAGRPNSIFSTFTFGMLGAGLGQALGVKAAHPDRPVYCIIGDGAMGMHVQEIETAVRERLAVTFIVLCDRQWGMVKITQQVGLGPLREAMGSRGQGTINTDLGEIRFDEVARAMGARGEHVTAPAELDGALRRCAAADQPAVVHVDVDPTRHLLPPGLLDFKEMHQEPGR